VGGSIYTSHTLNHLKELGLDMTALKLHSLCSMHTNCVQDELLKNLVALKVLVWSRGRLVTLQILTSFSIFLVEETHGSLGQYVSFSLIDVGSGSTAYVAFFSFLDLCYLISTLITNYAGVGFHFQDFDGECCSVADCFDDSL